MPDLSLDHQDTQQTAELESAERAVAAAEMADPLAEPDLGLSDPIASSGGEAVQMFANKRSSDMGRGPKAGDEFTSLDALESC